MANITISGTIDDAAKSALAILDSQDNLQQFVDENENLNYQSYLEQSQVELEQ